MIIDENFIQCGKITNYSEKIAFEKIENVIVLGGIKNKFYLLKNYSLFSGNNHNPLELDLVVISTRGIYVIEIKHWNENFDNDKQNDYINKEIIKLNDKCKILKSKIESSKILGSMYINGKFLLTDTKDNRIKIQKNGLWFYSLNNIKEILNLEGSEHINDVKIKQIKDYLYKGGDYYFSNKGYFNLKDLWEEGNHKVYSARKNNNDIQLHTFDLTSFSKSIIEKEKEKAKREFDILYKFSKVPFFPTLYEPFESLPDYRDEVCFYSIITPNYPSIENKITDKNWDIFDKIRFTANSLLALDKIHNLLNEELNNQYDKKLILRNLNSKNILVTNNINPTFTQLNYVKIPDAQTISENIKLTIDESIPPEISNGDIRNATYKSDIYSICYSLLKIFDINSEIGKSIIFILKRGLSKDAENRPSLIELHNDINSIFNSIKSKESHKIHYNKFEIGNKIKFKSEYYKITNIIGEGGIGESYKVIEINEKTNDEYGTYIGKRIKNQENFISVQHAYKKVKALTASPYLATIHEIASDWDQNSFVSILKWIPGSDLQSYKGYLHIIEDEKIENFLIEKLLNICDALQNLHNSNLVHGDINPRNILISENNKSFILIDYDSVVEIGSTPKFRNNNLYNSPNLRSGNSILPKDDLYSISITLLDCMLEDSPFHYQNKLNLERGINWELFEKFKLTKFIKILKELIENSSIRDASEAISFINSESILKNHPKPILIAKDKKRNERLLDILKTYPGSLRGNIETRGLDSNFAVNTYIKTSLEIEILDKIKKRELKLLILLGNAGDGKTALLQNLSKELGYPNNSSERLYNFITIDGININVNLDGSASYNDKSAIELLDEFFNPFLKNEVPSNLTSMLAINSGPFYKWISNLNEDSKLRNQFYKVLIEGDYSELRTDFRIMDLNTRSLVGNISENDKIIEVNFIRELILSLIGENFDQHWSECKNCISSNKCSTFYSMNLLHSDKKDIIINNLILILQLVHQLGKVHITIRELRAFISYVLYGINYCDDYHSNDNIDLEYFFNRIFDTLSTARQGELLKEISQLDPSLISHPDIDKYLLLSDNKIFNELNFTERKRKYFMTESSDEILKIKGDNNYFGINKAKHFENFLNFPLLTENERLKIKVKILTGISKINFLPSKAYENQSYIPFKVNQRTPTETVFWVNKEISYFKLEENQIYKSFKHQSILHNFLVLYYSNDINEKLLINYELYFYLLELESGTQLPSEITYDIFSNLSIFVDRITEEDSSEMISWTPLNEDNIYTIKMIMKDQIKQLEIS